MKRDDRVRKTVAWSQQIGEPYVRHTFFPSGDIPWFGKLNECKDHYPEFNFAWDD